MRAHRFVFSVWICAWLMAGCAGQGCLKYYSKNTATATLNGFSSDERSNVNVIRFSSFPAGGMNAFPKNVILGYYQDQQLHILDRDAYQTFQMNWRLYLFNLPPNTYYILGVFPDICRPLVLNDATDMSMNYEADARPEEGSQGPDTEPVRFDESNYQAFPVKIGSGRFNLLGQYRVKRDLFSTSGELIHMNELDSNEEIQYFQKLVREDCKWLKIVGAQP